MNEDGNTQQLQQNQSNILAQFDKRKTHFTSSQKNSKNLLNRSQDFYVTPKIMIIEQLNLKTGSPFREHFGSLKESSKVQALIAQGLNETSSKIEADNVKKADELFNSARLDIMGATPTQDLSLDDAQLP